MNDIKQGPVALGIGAALKQILARVFKYPYAAIFILLLMIVDVAFNMTLSLSLQVLIDFAIEPKSRVALRIIIISLAAGFLLSSGAQIARDYIYAWLGARVLDDLRHELLGRLSLLSPGYFARSRVGDLVARFSTDLGAVETAVISGIPCSLYALLHILFGVLVLVELEWRLTIFVFFGFTLCWVGPRLLSGSAINAGYAFRVEQAALVSAVEERISAQRVVRCFMLEDFVYFGIGSRSRRVATFQSRFSFLSNLVGRSPNIVMYGFVVLISAVGGAMVFNAAISIGALVSFNALFLTISNYVEALTASAPALLQGAGGMQRINELLNERPAIVDCSSARPLPRLSQAIVFENLSFGYTQSDRNLCDITLEIPSGWKVAIVGRSGSGKSTILNLLLRFYDPRDGRVVFDGIDLRLAQLATLYRQVGVVLQESFLFNASIRENIRLGALDASNARVERAARAAELDETSFGPAGLDTIVGERGDRLSGGQRQRVAIARALIREPSILVFDEAVSSLDPPAAAAINSLIERVTVGRTVISITHRLNDIVDYDRILRIGPGKTCWRGATQAATRKK